MKIKIFLAFFIILLEAYLIPPPVSFSLESDEAHYVATYTKAQVIRNNSIIEIELDTTIKLIVRNLQRFVALDPEKVSARRVFTDEIEITGRKLGYTFIHIWDEEGLTSFRVVGKQRGFGVIKELNERLRQEVERAEPFKVNYSLDFTRIKSESDYEHNRFKYLNYLHSATLTGETPYGYLDSRFRYEQKETTTPAKEEEAADITELNLRLKTDDFVLQAGDIFEEFSALSLPYSHFQGLSVKSSGEGKANYNIVWGSRGYLQWGRQIRSLVTVKCRG